MVRGLSIRLNNVFVFYPCIGFTSWQLYNVIWDAVGTLEISGFHVRAFCSDGARPNRKCYRLHQSEPDQSPVEPDHVEGNENKYTIVYPLNCTRNRFRKDSIIYFICYVPQLIKTTRNNWENSNWYNKTRNLEIDGKPVKWPQLVNLVEEDLGVIVSVDESGGFQENFDAVGKLRFLPRMSDDHLRLIPGSRMNVRLAVQWLEDKFLKFLDNWEEQCMEKIKLPIGMRRKMCLSRETLEGIRITVKSIIGLTKDLLLEGVKYVLTAKLNQDPLEHYFSKQRACGGKNENPNVSPFQINAQNLLVACSRTIKASTRGNCSVLGDHGQFKLDNTPLPRRKSTH